MRKAELLDQAAKAACLFDRVEVGALQVFDQAEHQLLVVARVTADDGGDRLQAGQPCGSPSALARDQLIAIRERPDEQRLQHTMEPDRFGQLAKRLGVEAGSHLLARGPDLIDCDHLRHQRLALARHRDQGIESATESAGAWLAHRSSSSFASARYAAAPRHVGSYSITDLPWLGASLMRTLRGMTVSKR